MSRPPLTIGKLWSFTRRHNSAVTSRWLKFLATSMYTPVFAQATLKLDQKKLQVSFLKHPVILILTRFQTRREPAEYSPTRRTFSTRKKKRAAASRSPLNRDGGYIHDTLAAAISIFNNYLGGLSSSASLFTTVHMFEPQTFRGPNGTIMNIFKVDIVLHEVATPAWDTAGS